MNPCIGLVDKPATLVDSKGRIVIWYLPDILPGNIHVQCLYSSNLCALFEHIFFQGQHDGFYFSFVRNSQKTPKTGECISWHVNTNNFARNSPTWKHVAGTETFSAEWYAQAHNVHPSSLHQICIHSNHNTSETKWPLGAITQPEGWTELRCNHLVAGRYRRRWKLSEHGAPSYSPWSPPHQFIHTQKTKSAQRHKEICSIVMVVLYWHSRY